MWVTQGLVEVPRPASLFPVSIKNSSLIDRWKTQGSAVTGTLIRCIYRLQKLPELVKTFAQKGTRREKETVFNLTRKKRDFIRTIKITRRDVSVLSLNFQKGLNLREQTHLIKEFCNYSQSYVNALHLFVFLSLASRRRKNTLFYNLYTKLQNCSK